LIAASSMRSRPLGCGSLRMRLPLLIQLLQLAIMKRMPVVQAALLLDEDFSCRMMGCVGHDITNLTYWRHSTTGSNQSYLSIGPAGAGRSGNAVNFSVSWCPPPDPNPQHLGCYRSELALQRDVQATMIDWKPGEGSSERCAPAQLRVRIGIAFLISGLFCRQGLASPTGCWATRGRPAPHPSTASTAHLSSCMVRIKNQATVDILCSICKWTPEDVHTATTAARESLPPRSLYAAYV
jgi:hypothetical protein